MARVTTAKAGKDYTCGRCRAPIPKGEMYRWAKPGFRSRTKLIRCADHACSFRQSELTTSKLAGLYAAQELAHDQLDAWDGTELEAMLEGIKEACEEARQVADEYTEANDAWTAEGGADNEEWVERADAIEAWLDEVGDLEPEEFDEDEVRTNAEEDGRAQDLLADELVEWVEAEIEAAREAWADEVRVEVGDVIDGCDLP